MRDPLMSLPPLLLTVTYLGPHVHLYTSTITAMRAFMETLLQEGSRQLHGFMEFSSQRHRPALALTIRTRPT